VRSALLLAAAAAAAGCALPGDPAGPPRPSEAGTPFEGLRAWTEQGIRVRAERPSIRVGGSFAADYVQWDRRNARTPGAAGHARPAVDASWGKDFRVLVEGDLVGSETPDHLLQAWAEWRVTDALRLRAGRMSVPLGTELATPEEDLPVRGRSFTSWLDGRTDLGARAAGALAADGLWYEATATSGNGFGLDGRRRTSPQQSLRAAVRPFRLAGADREGVLGGAFLAAAAARLGDFEDPVVLETPLGIPVFSTPDLDGDGGRWLHLEGGFAAGPVAGGVEVVRGAVTDVRLPAGDRGTLDELTAWTATLAVSLTGERRGWEEGRWTRGKPRLPGGAWELAVRYSNGDIDRDLFRAGWTTYDPSTQEVRTFSALLGWRPAGRVRVAFGWVKTIADDALTVFGSAGSTRVARVSGSNRDSSYVLRVEIGF
jgi:phosphate-selective porin